MLKAREIEKLSGSARLRVWAVALTSGILLTLTVPPNHVPGLVLVALAPLLLALPRLSAGGAFVSGFLCGTAYFWINMWWLGQMGTDPGNEFAVFAMFAFVAVGMSTFYGVCCMCMRWVLTRQAAWPVWLVPLIWLGFEFAHEFDTPAPYPWMALSQGMLSLRWLIQTADLWGSYGLSMIAVSCALALAAPFELAGPQARFSLRKAGVNRFAIPAAALIAVLGSCVYGLVRIAQLEERERGDGPLIACVQGNLKQEVKVSQDPMLVPKAFENHLQLSNEAAAKNAELIVWPETMLFGGSTRDGLSFRHPEMAATFYDQGKPDPILLMKVSAYGDYVGRLRAEIYYRLNRPMLVGVICKIPKEERFDDWKDYETGRVYNTAMLFDAEGKPAGSYDKRFLVPGGEYIPRENTTLIRMIVEEYSRRLQGRARYLEPGVQTTMFSFQSGASPWRFTSSICYEFVWGQCFRELHKRDDGKYPDFHINISNEGWFKQSAELDQAVNYCRLRSIESRVPMVRATNTGITCTIDATGRVRETFTVNGKDREVGGLFLTRPPVLKDPGPTFFISHVGRLPGWLSLCVIIPIMALMAAGRIKERWARKSAQAHQNKTPEASPEKSPEAK